MICGSQTPWTNGTPHYSRNRLYVALKQRGLMTCLISSETDDMFLSNTMGQWPATYVQNRLYVALKHLGLITCLISSEIDDVWL